MNLPLNFLRLQPANNSARPDSAPRFTSVDVPPSKPLFRAPALPTPNQFSSELPFTVNIRPRLRDRT